MTGPGEDPPVGDGPFADSPDAAVVYLRTGFQPPPANAAANAADAADADADGDGDGRSAVSLFEPAERAAGSPAERSDEKAAREEWRWVQEWRAGAEPTPWATGLGLTLFVALVVGVAVWVLSAGLAGRPAVAVGVNLLVAGGLSPAMWLSRDLPVLRWIAAGALLGIVAGWIAALLMLPLPAP